MHSPWFSAIEAEIELYVEVVDLSESLSEVRWRPYDSKTPNVTQSRRYPRSIAHSMYRRLRREYMAHVYYDFLKGYSKTHLDSQSKFSRWYVFHRKWFSPRWVLAKFLHIYI
jgi:hypothetical protein